MSVDSDAEAAFAVADSWYSLRLSKRYNLKIAKTLRNMMIIESRNLPLYEVCHLKMDFAKNFPTHPKFFSEHYSRFWGYAENSWTGGHEKDTREFETMAPAFEVRKKSDDLVRIISDSLDKNPHARDAAVESAFASSFETLGDFSAFCLGYLRTRMLNSHAKKLWNVGEGRSEMRKRNFRRVWHALSYFNICIFGDLLEPVTSSSKTLMPPQYPFQDVYAQSKIS